LALAVGSGGTRAAAIGVGGAEATLQGYAEERAEALQALVGELEDLVDWCTRKKLFLERDRVYRMILYCDPEHGKARVGLGYRRESDGTWKEDPDRRAPKNFDKKSLERFPEELANATSSFVAERLALLDREDAPPTPDERALLYADVLAFDPDNSRVHALREEVQLDGAWVLAETARGKERRPALKDSIREAYRTAPRPQPAPLTDAERSLGVEFRHAASTPEVRVLGTGDEEEVVRAAITVQATLQVFRTLFDAPDAKLEQGFTVYLLADYFERDPFLDAYPGLDPDYRESLRALEGSGIQGVGHFVHWAEDPRQRLDALVHFCLGWLLADGFQIMPGDGWLFEGIGLYLTRELVGTRLNWFVLPSQMVDPESDQALRAKLLDSDTNWVNEGYLLLQMPNHPSLEQLFPKTVSQLTTEDMLLAYVAAAYLIEGREDAGAPLLRAIGSGKKAATAVGEALGRTPEEWDARLQRWLSERR